MKKLAAVVTVILYLASPQLCLGKTESDTKKIVQTEVIDFLTKNNRHKLDTKDFKGEVTFPNVKSTVVEVTDIHLHKDVISAKATIAVDAKAVGKVRLDQIDFPVDAHLRLHGNVDVKLTLARKGSQIYAVPGGKINKLRFEPVEITSPKQGQNLLLEIAQEELELRQVEISKSISKSLAKKKIKFGTVSANSNANASANPVLRQLLQSKVAELLKTYSSPNKPLANVSEKKRKKIGFVRVTVTKANAKVWIKDPNKVVVDVTRFEMKNGNLTFAAQANAGITGKCSGKVLEIGGSSNVRAKASLAIVGTCQLKDGRFSNASISKLDGVISDLRLSNDLFNLFRTPIRKAANSAINKAEGKWKSKLAAEINKLKL